jgi:hypothetical protein
MFRMVKAALLGILIGIAGGGIIGEISYLKYLKNKSEEVDYEDNDELVSDIEKSSGLWAFAGEYENLLEALDDISVTEAEDTANEKGYNDDVIRLVVDYKGTVETDEKEAADLEKAVRQAVALGLSEKLGENYNQDMTRDEIRQAFIMSFENIKDWALKVTEELGVNAEADVSFECRYMDLQQEGTCVYPAGYYETLCIELTDGN